MGDVIIAFIVLVVSIIIFGGGWGNYNQPRKTK